MLFVDSCGNSFDLDIVGYEFYEHSKEKSFDWDANWLIVKIIYDEDNYIREYEDACLLTFELADFVRDIENLKKHKIQICELNTMEPYLKIKVTYETNYIFNLQYIQNKVTGDKINFISVVNENEIQYYCDEFKKLAEKFKKR